MNLRIAQTWSRRGHGPARRVPLLIAVPAVACVVLFRFVPGLAGIRYSLTDWNGSGSAHWVGLDNYRSVFSDATTRIALGNTVKLAVGTALLANVFGLLIALGVHRMLKTRHVLRSLYFLPVVMLPLASAFAWQYIYGTDGLVNRLLGVVGLASWQHAWLGDPKWALWAILSVLVWNNTGLTMIIYLAGLQAIPPELDEAAAADCASTWTRFRRITLPLLAPAITINVTLMTIIGLTTFDQILAMTGGGPVNSTETIATQIWRQTFQFGHYGLGSALAVAFSVVVVAASLAQIALLRTRERRMS